MPDEIDDDAMRRHRTDLEAACMRQLGAAFDYLDVAHVGIPDLYRGIGVKCMFQRLPDGTIKLIAIKGDFVTNGWPS